MHKRVIELDVGDIWTIELLCLSTKPSITLLPLRCSLRHLALSSRLSLLTSHPLSPVLPMML